MIYTGKKTRIMNSLPFKNPLSLERSFFGLAFVLLGAALLTGILAALVSLSPAFLRDALPFARLRPLHTFFSMSGLIAGMLGLFEIMQLQIAKPPAVAPKEYNVYLLSFFAFCFSATISIIWGHATGREYFSWPPILTPLLLMPLVRITYLHFAGHSRLIAESPEGFWLTGTGIALLVGGIMESQLWL
ncbi:MAG: hypothetical protein AB1403_25560, partial [Candidatus Riflebacteria bacterium]